MVEVNTLEKAKSLLKNFAVSAVESASIVPSKTSFSFGELGYLFSQEAYAKPIAEID